MLRFFTLSSRPRGSNATRQLHAIPEVLHVQVLFKLFRVSGLGCRVQDLGVRV